ncbi:MAG: alpha/beta hydrolase [Bacteroidetes bacterium]|nr:alpha/beta hydrolase [Bacteroidota bacterium]
MKKLVIPGLLVLLGIVYFTGPAVEPFVPNDNLPAIVANLAQVENYVQIKESSPEIKSMNQSRLSFADSLPKKGKIALLYLHGFGASPYEGEPVHTWFASRYGMNMYIPRLAEHGLKGGNAMLNLSATALWESAKEAYAIAKTLGDSVIIMGTSTGCTLGLMLAARYPEVKGLLMMSPNIRLKDPAAFLINNPWGKEIARMVVGSDSFTYQLDEEFGKYWYNAYRLEAVAHLEELLETQMTEGTFGRINQPALTLFYCKDSEHCDQLVNTGKMAWMHAHLATPENQKRLVNLPEAGDHILGNPIRSKDVEGVQREMQAFAETVLNLKPLKP